MDLASIFTPLFAIGIAIVFLGLRYGFPSIRESYLTKREWKGLFLFTLILLVNLTAFVSARGSHVVNSILPESLSFISIMFVLHSYVLAPVFEELLFRRYIFETLRSNFKITIACLITGFIGATLHLQFEPLLFLFHFISGIFTSIVFLFCGLSGSIFIHSLMNLYLDLLF